MNELHLNIFLFIHHSLSPEGSVALVTIFFAKWFPFIVALVPLFPLFPIHQLRDALRKVIYIYGPPTIAYALVELIKFVFPEPRPFVSLDFTPLVLGENPYGAFPSAHATYFAALAVTMYMHYPRTGIWFFGAALLIGIARIGAGVHWPVDIFGGLFFGLVLGFVIEKLMLRVEQKNCKSF